MSDNASSFSSSSLSPSAASGSGPTSPDSAPEPSMQARIRGYFNNQEQLQDLKLAETVLTAARAHAAEMPARDITGNG